MPIPAAAATYRRREPEKDPLYEVLAEHLETFLDRARSGDHRVPGHVERELRDYLECGILYVQSDTMCSWSVLSRDIGL